MAHHTEWLSLAFQVGLHRKQCGLEAMVGSTANTLASAKKSMLTAGEEGNRPRLVPDEVMADYEYSGPFTEWALTGNIALRYDQKLEWYAKKMRVTNLPEANTYVTRTYRDGWDLGV